METKKYEAQSESEGMACEPLLGGYGSAAAAESEEADEVSELPSDILGKAIEITLIEEREGKLLPLDVAFDMIYEDLGWK